MENFPEAKQLGFRRNFALHLNVRLELSGFIRVPRHRLDHGSDPEKRFCLCSLKPILERDTADVLGAFVEGHVSQMILKANEAGRRGCEVGIEQSLVSGDRSYGHCFGLRDRLTRTSERGDEILSGYVLGLLGNPRVSAG